MAQLRSSFAFLALLLSLTTGPAAHVASAQVDGVPRGSGLLARQASSGKVLWQKSGDARRPFREAAADGDLVVVTAAQCTELAKVRTTLTAIDARTGQERWEVPGSGVAAQTAFWQYSQPVPVSASGVVVVGGGRFIDGVRGLDARTGVERWAAPAGYRELGVSETLLFAASGDPDVPKLEVRSRTDALPAWTFPTQVDPGWTGTFDVVAADRDTVVVVNGDYLTTVDGMPNGPITFFVLDARTGLERTRFVEADPRIEFSGFQMSGGTLVYVEGVSSVVARSLTDGAVLWKHELPAPAASVGTTREIASLQPALGAPTALVDVEERGVLALDVTDGTLLWQREGANVAAAGVDRAQIYDSGSAQFAMVDTRTGAVLWNRAPERQLLPPHVMNGSRTIAGGRLLVAGLCDTE